MISHQLRASSIMLTASPLRRTESVTLAHPMHSTAVRYFAKDKGGSKSPGHARLEDAAGFPVDIAKYDTLMKGVSEAFKQSLSKYRIGAANPAVLDGLHVESATAKKGTEAGDDAHDVSVPLNKVAQVSVKDANTLQVTVFEAAWLAPVEKSLRSSWMQLVPVRDNNVLTVTLPRMTKEFRQSIAKYIKESAEKFKGRIRQHRAKALKAVKDTSGVSKDDIKRMETLVQSISEKHCVAVDQLCEAKAAEVLSGK